MPCWLRGLLLSVALHALWTGYGNAQPSPGESTTRAAQREHKAAVEAFANGAYPEAVEHFSAADRLRPNPAFAFNIAKAYEAQGDTSHALAFYRDYLRRTGHPPDAALVTQRVYALSAELAEHGVQQMSVRSTPPGAAAFLDSEPIGVTPSTLDVKPGKHVLELRLAGHQRIKTIVALEPDRPLEAVFALTPQPQREQAAWSEPEPTQLLAPPGSGRGGQSDRRTEAAPSQRSRTGSVLRTVGFAALGASVAAIGGAVTFEVLRADSADAAKREREQVKVADQLETMRSRQTVARVLAGTGGALAVLGGVMLVSGMLSGQERTPRTGLALACQPSKCVGTLSGTF